MSDDLPESIKLKLYKKMLSQAVSRQEDQAPREDPEKVVHSRLSDERAVELMDKLKSRYPDIYGALVNELYKAIEKSLISRIDGFTLYSIISRLGLDIKPEIRIKFVKHGKEVDLKDYLS